MHNIKFTVTLSACIHTAVQPSPLSSSRTFLPAQKETLSHGSLLQCHSQGQNQVEKGAELMHLVTFLPSSKSLI